jgi:hypothetical protein
MRRHSRTHDDVPGPFRVDLHDVRRLEISYSLARPYKADLAVEYVGGRVRVFVVDRFLIERLLEWMEYGEA